MLFMQYLQNNMPMSHWMPLISRSNCLRISEALSAGLEHERYVTGLIHVIYDADLFG